MVNQEFTTKTKILIDNLKGVCANYGLSNDGNEFKIITQVFLYKFMNDKFGYEVKRLDPKLEKSDKWEKEISSYSDQEYQMLLLKMSPDSAKLKREHYLSYLHNQQNQEQFSKLFDDTLRDIAIYNNDIFSVKTGTGVKIKLFDELSQFISDSSKRDSFCRALINQLVNFSFEQIFDQKFDFFATIFEYLIKDYNKDGGGNYGEYYTPHAVAKIMASILVNEKVKNVTCCDPAAGSGTLLMSLAHAIGEDRCTIYSQDISQKSTGMLRLNLILNNLVHSIQNIIQDNTLTNPYHRDGDQLKKFDYIVSNPPFKLDFSEYRNELDTKTNQERFFAGIPKIPKKDLDKMPIYLLFIQHIMYSLSNNGKAAIVVPSGFLTAKKGIEAIIRKKLIEKNMFRGAISMPSNIFATTGTNVAVILIDKKSSNDGIVLMDASHLGKIVKEGKNQKTILSEEEGVLIVNTFNNREVVDKFSVVVSSNQIREKGFSFNAGRYFDIKIEYIDIKPSEFKEKIRVYTDNLNTFFSKSKEIDNKILENFKKLSYD